VNVKNASDILFLSRHVLKKRMTFSLKLFNTLLHYLYHFIDHIFYQK